MAQVGDLVRVRVGRVAVVGQRAGRWYGLPAAATAAGGARPDLARMRLLPQHQQNCVKRPNVPEHRLLTLAARAPAFENQIEDGPEAGASFALLYAGGGLDAGGGAFLPHPKLRLDGRVRVGDRRAVVF